MRKPKSLKPMNWWQSLLACLVMMAILSALFILLSLAIHGHVRWA